MTKQIDTLCKIICQKLQHSCKRKLKNADVKGCFGCCKGVFGYYCQGCLLLSKLLDGCCKRLLGSVVKGCFGCCEKVFGICCNRVVGCCKGVFGFCQGMFECCRKGVLRTEFSISHRSSNIWYLLLRRN